jgi:hypothetical protein
MYSIVDTPEHSLQCFNFFINQQIHDALFGGERYVDEVVFERLMMILLNIYSFSNYDMTEENLYQGFLHDGVTEITAFIRRSDSSIYSDVGKKIRNEQIKAKNKIIELMKENNFMKDSTKPKYLNARPNNKYQH